MFRFSATVLMALMSSRPSTASQQYPEKECKSIADIACTTPDFETLCNGLKHEGLFETLAGPGNFTVFAPTNKAFSNRPAPVEAVLNGKDVLLYHVVLEELLSSDLVCSGLVEMANKRDTRTRCENHIALCRFLLYHTVAGKVVTPDDLVCGDLLTMTNGKDTRTLCNGDHKFQKGAGNDKKESPEIVGGDVKACNGLIYVIDGVILPK